MNVMRVAAVWMVGELMLSTGGAWAQTTVPRLEGALVLMAGSAEMEVDNDEAVVNFYLEVQDADLSKAQSLLNQRVAEAVARMKGTGAKAQLETGGYGSYPVYADSALSSKTNSRNLVAWRVRQGVTVRTEDLVLLPKVIAAGQQYLALGGVQFRVSRVSREKYETELIQRAMANLNSKVAAAAQALGVAPQKVRIEDLNFGTRINDALPVVAYAQTRVASDTVAEVAWASGKTTLRQSVDGRVRMILP